jgi:chromosome segregation ATPase
MNETSWSHLSQRPTLTQEEAPVTVPIEKIPRITFTNNEDLQAMWEVWNDIRKTQQKHGEKLNRHTELLERHTAYHKEHKSSLLELRRVVARLELQHDRHEVRLANMGDDVSELKTDVSELKTDVSEIKGTLAVILSRLPERLPVQSVTGD